MKICFDARVIINEKTGIGNYSLNLLRSLLELDQQNLYTVLVNSRLDDDHEIYTLNYPNLVREKVNIPPVSIHQQYLIPFLLRKIKPDIYHYPNWDVPIFHRYKTIVTIHDLTYVLHRNLYKRFYHAKKLYTRLNIYWGLKQAEKVIVVSKSTKEDLVKYFQTPEHKIEVIYEAMNHHFLKNGSAKNEIRVDSQDLFQNNNYFLYVGERRPHKNLVRMIEAFALFKEQSPGNFKFLIGGKDYNHYDEPEKKVNELGLSGDVNFIGYIPDEKLKPLYSKATCFMFASIYEGFGIPILEAMSCGTPVITSNISSMPEIADNAAIKVNPYDVDEIANAMLAVVRDENIRSDYVERGKARAREFSWEKAAKQTLALYEKMRVAD
ncbi:MAG: glycosyltransferase family 4 protein [Candidatus Zhuqueibacterota bacterium]